MIPGMRLVMVALLLFAVSKTLAPANSFATSPQSSSTINERLEHRAVILFAQPVNEERPSGEDAENEPFEIETILKGGSHIRMSESIETRRLSSGKNTHVFMIEGEVDKEEPDVIHWSAALPLTKESYEDIASLPRKFDSPVERLTFFMSDLEHDDPIILSNAHLEFAIAEDETLEELKSEMDREQLREWVVDSTIAKERKRLYFIMLGICGNEDDGEWIGAKLLAEEFEFTAPAIAAWLLLCGEEALQTIDSQTFSRAGMGEEIDYVGIYNAIMAVRYAAAQSDPVFSRKRIAQSFRRILEMPTMADLVILDLLALEDWESIEQIVMLYEGEDETTWCRVPAVLFMRVCPLEEAKKHLERFKEIDEKSYQRAFMFYLDENLDSYRTRRKPNIRPRGRQLGRFC